MSFPAKVKELFLTLQSQGKFTANLANNLCNIDFCKAQELQTEFPVLRPRGSSEFDDNKKHRRYYPHNKFCIKIQNDEYVFTNNWFARNESSIQKFFSQYLDIDTVRKKIEDLHPCGDDERIKKTTAIRRKRNISKWPSWELPSTADIKQIAYLLTPYLKFLHPEIIKKVTLSNNEIYSYFHDYLINSGIDVKSYIWENCPIMFPGIRRANGKTDNKYKKKQLPKELRKEKQAIFIDDNSYPKHIWAFLFTNQQFSNKGPNGYELAHIFEHKAVSRIKDEFTIENNSTYDLSEPISGMFTNAASLMYSPRTFVKITDHSLHARRLIQRKVIHLYKGVTNLLPPAIVLRSQSEEWDINSFKWGEPVGDPYKIDQFLEYRIERIKKILAFEIPQNSVHEIAEQKH